MLFSINDLGSKLNVDVLNSFIELQGKQIVDAGCGSMTFSSILAEQGAEVFAIDPDPIQAELNRKQALDPRIKFFETGAESLPFGDNTIDGVVFSYSLHHIAEHLFPLVFQETIRVLKPRGFLYVIEPIDCPFNQVMKHFHDEDREREAAWDALQTIAAPRFQSCQCVQYTSKVKYKSWNEFTQRFGNRSFNPGYTLEDVKRTEVREAFEKHAAQTQDGFEFEAPKRAVFMSDPIRT